MTVRRSVTALLLMFVTSACQVTVTYTTQLEEDGSGEFSFGIELDEEAVQQLEAQRTPSLFEALERGGWEVSRTEPDGRLLLTAARSFEEPGDLSEVFAELRAAADDGGTGDFGGINLALSADRHSDPVSTTTDVSGSIDFGRLAELDQGTKAELGRAITFEIVADLPGDARVSGGDADIDDRGRVVWRPRFGEPMVFAATSTVREPALFLGLLLAGAALLLAVLAMIARSSRKRYRVDALEAFRLEEMHGIDGAFAQDPFASESSRPDLFGEAPAIIIESTGIDGEVISSEGTISSVDDVIDLEPAPERDPFR